MSRFVESNAIGKRKIGNVAPKAIQDGLVDSLL
jgi:hypothetical protein